MRYGGNFMTNFSSAEGAGDKKLQRDMFFDEVAFMIKTYPNIVAGALKNSGVEIQDGFTMRELIKKTVRALYRNEKFRYEFANLIVAVYTGAMANTIALVQHQNSSQQYSNSAGSLDSGQQVSNAINTTASSTGSGASGGIVGLIIGAVVGITTSSLNYASAKKLADAEEEKAQAMIISKLLGNNEKGINWIPIIILGGVLLIGGIAVYFTLKKTK